MTAREQRIVANGYYVRAMQMFEDHQAGLTEFVREEEVFDLLYDIASDFYEWTLEIKDERVNK
jgi:hypothetical protein